MDKKAIMIRAWKIRKTQGFDMSKSLKMAWDESKHENQQMAAAKKILSSLDSDGRFSAKLWEKEGKVRVYVESYGNIAIGKDGTAYPNLTRYKGNIKRAAGL